MQVYGTRSSVFQVPWMVLADVSHNRMTLSEDTENSRHALSTFFEADRERAAIGDVLAALDRVCTVFP